MAADTRAWGIDGEQAPLVAATAAINGVGFDSHQTWAFWRAESSPFAASPFRLPSGERATMCHLRTLPPASVGVERMAAMTEAALSQIEPELVGLPEMSRLRVALCLSQRFEDPKDLYFGPQLQHLKRSLLRWFAVRELEPELMIEPRGHAAFARGLLRGCVALMDGQLDALLIGGVDTSYDPLLVDILMEQERIFDEVNPDSFIPGEGAAFALIGRKTLLRNCGLTPLASIDCAATAQEPAGMLTEEPCTGQGLTAVMRACTDRLRKEKRLLDWILGDLTNEDYRGTEFQLAYPRAIAPGGLDTAGATYQEVAADDLELDFLPEVFGDLGAATMPTALTLASESFIRGSTGAGSCLILGSSVTEDRGAALISPVRGKKGS